MTKHTKTKSKQRSKDMYLEQLALLVAKRMGTANLTGELELDKPVKTSGQMIAAVEQLADVIKNRVEMRAIAAGLDKKKPMLKFLAGVDLGAQNLILSAHPESRALGYLFQLAHLFGIETEYLQRQLYVKHHLVSGIGHHIILAARPQHDELLGHLFVVHLDHKNRIVMVTSHYDAKAFREIAAEIEAGRGQPLERKQKNEIIKNAVAQTEYAKYVKKVKSMPAWLRVPKEKGEELAKAASDTLSTPRPVAAPKWVYGLQIKALCKPSQSYTIYVAPKQVGEKYEAVILKSFLTTVYDSEFVTGVGKKLKDLYVPIVGAKPSELERTFGDTAALEDIVLRDLKSLGDFSGRYVRVDDDLADETADTFPIVELDVEAGLAQTILDRMMAYYHTDRLQRFFRGLGLNVLDTYAELNPLAILLDKDLAPGENRFESHEQKVHLTRLVKGKKATYAREPRAIYHEVTHAITDALARLSRGESNAMIAMALDEGYADYFAASMVWRDGTNDVPLYYKIGSTRTDPNGIKKFSIGARRQLVPAPTGQETNALVKPSDDSDQLGEPGKYELANLWSRYLWQLREKLGPELADRIIAHSILFLTRWADFAHAILALALADYLLFGQDPEEVGSVDLVYGGKHERIIYELLPKGAGESLWNDWLVVDGVKLVPSAWR